MNELKEPAPARPLNKSLLGDDAAALNNLLGMLNNPAITGAEVPQGESTRVLSPAEAERATQPAAPQPVEADIPIPAALVAATANIPPTGRKVVPYAGPLVFTGQPGAGKSYLVAHLDGAQEFEIGAPATALANFLFPLAVAAHRANGFSALVETIRVWGEGETSEKFPLSPARACFTLMIRSLAKAASLPPGVDWTQYGLTAGFWMDTVVAQAKAFSGRAIITGVRSVVELNYLRAQAFRHWHVMASPKTVASRVATVRPDGLASALDHDTTKKISQQRDGNRLHVIWSDHASPAPSQRLYPPQDFFAETAAVNAPVTGE